MIHLFRKQSFLLAICISFVLMFSATPSATPSIDMVGYFDTTLSSSSKPLFGFSHFDLLYGSTLSSDMSASAYLSVVPVAGGASTIMVSEAIVTLSDPYHKFMTPYMPISAFRSLDMSLGLHLIPFGIITTTHAYERDFSDYPLAFTGLLPPSSLEGMVLSTPLAMMPLAPHISIGAFNGGTLSTSKIYTVGVDTSIVGADVGVSYLKQGAGSLIGLDMTYPLLDSLSTTIEMIQDTEASRIGLYGAFIYTFNSVIDLGLRYDYLEAADAGGDAATLITFMAKHALASDSFIRLQANMDDEGLNKSIAGDIVIGF